MSKYNEIMEHITVTDEMRERVIANVKASQKRKQINQSRKGKNIPKDSLSLSPAGKLITCRDQAQYILHRKKQDNTDFYHIQYSPDPTPDRIKRLQNTDDQVDYDQQRTDKIIRPADPVVPGPDLNDLM